MLSTLNRSQKFSMQQRKVDVVKYAYYVTFTEETNGKTVI
jgi:hypothetical protein